MSSADLPNPGFNAVRTGWWTDYDAGRIRGGRLTLKNQEAAALLGFLAVAVTFAGNRSWKILRFALYRCFRNTDADVEDARKWSHRIKLLLRNVITAASACWMFLTQAWESHGKHSAPGGTIRLIQSAGLAIGAGVHVLAVVAAGILTSRILLGRMVVSKPLDSCGQWEARDNASTLSYQSLRRNETVDSDNYVRNCYPQGVSLGILDCEKLFTRWLPHQVEHKARCPFGLDLCTLGDNAFAMDSGPITFSSLGINSKFGLSLSVQRRSTCITVPGKPFLEKIYTSKDLPTILTGNETIWSYAFSISNGKNQSIWYRNPSSSQTYDLGAYHLIHESPDIIEPLRPSSPRDHDPSIILLRSNGVLFRNASDDPWFSVHTKVNLSDGTSNGDIWVADHFLNILACDERVRFCSSITNNCTAWMGLFGPGKNIDTLIPLLAGTKIGSAASQEVLQTVAAVALRQFYSSLPSSIQYRQGSEALQASRYLLASGSQYLLAPEQWKVELDYWFSMALARLQLGLFNTIEKPAGVSTAEAENAWDRFKTSDFKLGMCGRIKYNSAEHATLSALGIIIVLVFVGVLTLGSFLDVILGWVPAVWAQKMVEEWEEMESVTLLEELERLRERIARFNDPHEVREFPK